jgi:SAM-dependent methyltransferase
MNIKEIIEKLKYSFQLDEVVIDKGWITVSFKLWKIVKIFLNPLIQCPKPMSKEVIDKVINFNAYTRDEWVAKKAKTINQGAKVLDVGAGQCPYRNLFSHCRYMTQDFIKYQGTTSGPQIETWNYGKIDYTCDITDIPVPDESFDAILCTEVIEHIPNPITALQELSRILIPGGRLFLTAPLCSGLHQEPYHYYSGFSPHFYNKFLAEFNLEIVEITPIGGLMKHVGQEIHRVGRLLMEMAPDKLPGLVQYNFLHRYPVYLSKLDDEVFIEEFTVGYLLEAVKKTM